MSTAADPPSPETSADHAARGHALWAAGDAPGAIAAYAKALSGNPRDAQSAMNLAHALAACANLDAALAWMRHAHAINPADPVLEMNLGVIHQRRGEIDEAAACYARAIAIRPDYAEAWLNYGNAALYSGDPAAAIRYFEQALANGPHLDKALSNIVYTLSYVPDATRRDIRRRAAEWNARFALPASAGRPAGSRHDPDRPLRVGYISADLGNHPIGHFMMGVLAHHDRDVFPVTVYSERAAEDEMTVRMKGLVARWHNTIGLPDPDLAALIATDGIDVLVDVAGHTSGNRLRVFTARPAPLQMTWGIASVGTTGVAAMDYLIADGVHVRPGEEDDYVERVLRLPDALVCYVPPAAAPAVGPLPVERNRVVTFGSFSNPAKIGEELMAAWTQILGATPGSRLVLKYRWMDAPANRRRIEAAFARGGIAADRLIIEGESLQPELLARYNDIDIALDTQPYSGGATTLEALWMGVPVVTRPGNRFAGRHSASFLAQLGLEALIADSWPAYIRIATGLAADRARLADLRATLRQRLSGSTLMDSARFTRQLEDAFRAAWRDHGEGVDKDDFR